MYVAHDVQRAGPGRRGLLGDVVDLDRVAGAALCAPADDGQVALRGRVPLGVLVLGRRGRVRHVRRDGREARVRADDPLVGHVFDLRAHRDAVRRVGAGLRPVLGQPVSGCALTVVRGVLAVHRLLAGQADGRRVRGGFDDRHAEVSQRVRPHRGSLTGPLSHRPLHHRRAAVHLRTL